MDGTSNRNIYWDVLGTTDIDIGNNQKESGLNFNYTAPYDLPPLHKNVVAQMQGSTTSTDEAFMPQELVSAEHTTQAYFPTGGYYRRQFRPTRSWGDRHNILVTQQCTRDSQAQISVRPTSLCQPTT